MSKQIVFKIKKHGGEWEKKTGVEIVAGIAMHKENGRDIYTHIVSGYKIFSSLPRKKKIANEFLKTIDIDWLKDTSSVIEDFKKWREKNNMTLDEMREIVAI